MGKILEDKLNKYNFINKLFADVEEKDRCIYENVLFFGNEPELEEAEDKFVYPDTLKANVVKVKGATLQLFINLLVETAVVTITKDNVGDVDVDKYDEMTEQVAILQRQLDEKNEEWRQERMKSEENRTEETIKKISEAAALASSASLAIGIGIIDPPAAPAEFFQLQFTIWGIFRRMLGLTD